MAGVGAPWEAAMGSLSERGKRGKGRRRKGARLGGGMGGAGGAMGRARSFLVSCCALWGFHACCMWEGNRKEEEEKEEREEKEKEGKKRKKAENMKKIQTWKFPKNKKQFMKLVKNYFCTKKE
jgi:hypothetical protein